MRVNILVLLFSICLTGVGLHGQMLTLASKRQQPQIIWGEDSIALIEELGKKAKIGDLATGRYQQVVSPSPSILLGLSASNDVTYSVLLKDQNFLYGRRQASGVWEENLIDTDHKDGERGFPVFLYESSIPDLFFAINVDTGFVMDGEASCCAWWRMRPDGQLELKSVIPIDFNGPAFWCSRANGKIVYASQSPTRKGLAPFLDYPIRVPGAFVLVSWKAGILWVIKDGNPFPTRTIELLSLDKEFIDGKHPFPPVILGIQPMRNGHILIARRMEKAITETYKRFKVIPTTSQSPEWEYRFATSERNASTMAYPEIVWAELDPMTGTIEKPDGALVAPAPPVLKTEQDAMRFTFGFDHRQRLIIPWSSPATVQLEKKVGPKTHLAPTSDAGVATKPDSKGQAQDRLKVPKS